MVGATRTPDCWRALVIGRAMYRGARIIKYSDVSGGEYGKGNGGVLGGRVLCDDGYIRRGGSDASVRELRR